MPMSEPEPGPNGQPIRVVKSGVAFVCEQDGPPERQLKAGLTDLFARHPSVRRAYLAIVHYPGSSARHVALCVQSADGEDQTLAAEIGTVFRSLFGSHEHLDTIFLNASQDAQIARVCNPFFVATPADNDAPPPDFTPRMPEVDVPADLEARFAKARRIGSGDEIVAGRGGPVHGQRHVVIVTPGRMCMMYPCPRPGSMQASAVAAIEQIAPSSTPLTIAVIALTELRAVRASLAKAIPFVGYLLGLAYVGHTVVVFEGHASALRPGCRDADLLIVDEAMMPALPRDWLSVAWSVMRAPQALVFGRTGTLKRLTRKMTPPVS
jgi:hypothetical protein